MDKEEKIKGFRIEEELYKEVNKVIKVSGLKDGEWLKSVMNLSVLHDIKANDPSIENDLDELVKVFNRAYHIVIRQHQRAADRIDEVKDKNQDDTKKLEDELKTLREELAEQKKVTKKQSDELDEIRLKNQELTERISHFDQVTISNAENIQLKNEKIENLETRVQLLIASENELSLLKEEVTVLVAKHANDMASSKEVESALRGDVEKMSQEISKLSSESIRELQRKDEDHQKELMMLEKEIMIKMRDELLTEKNLWHEKTNKAIEELNQKHNNAIKELVQSFSKGRKNEDELN
ncbi:hypothetical protein OM416_19850 [Paenibacillus sp. LS1]|uniref:hypothetical protein n=1 Tax=Paenibacillus sp. LS1 TaxID=2992120 RepID=UPI0022316A91|nr:hypothetical protein [Paenibacillus sp. LS1]MCW3793850.1 hypothetical protein [Paenibacillus sp. LS1]